jgi:hypothetical protein
MRSINLLAGLFLLGGITACGGAVDESSSTGSAADSLGVQQVAVCSSAQVVRQIGGRTTPPLPIGGTAIGSGALQLPELRREARVGEFAGSQLKSAAQAVVRDPESVTHRSLSRHHRSSRSLLSTDTLTAPVVRSTAVAGATPRLAMSFDGLNLYDQRVANGGNQYSVEPPDQGLCVGNGFVLETINTVMRVFDTSGAPVTGVVDLNTFYGYPAQIDRATGAQGPFVTDPTCYYDPDVRRWFHVVLTLDVDPTTGDFLGSNHLDVAVSASADPTGAWSIHQVPVQDDGTDGTPNHGCSLGPCIGDFPHIGADKYGFYVTTNEYSLNGPEFKSAQVYAFSKAALASGAPTVTVVQFDTTSAVGGAQPGFGVWPATSTEGRFDTGRRGTEYFLSSNAAEEASGVTGGTFSNQVVLWAASNSRSLDSATPCVSLSNTVLSSEVYGIPPESDQKVGNVPLADCLNADCLGKGVPATPEVEGGLDSSDTRILQVWHANGSLWGALDTVVNVGGEERAGVAYFLVDPQFERGGRLDGRMVKQGYLAVAGNNVIYPAMAVRPDGRGAMGFTLVGKDHYPSAAFTFLHGASLGDVHVAAEGRGPQDGSNEYQTFGGRARWGDYGAAVTDGRSIWFASEYIAQTCTYEEYTADPTCGGTRVQLGNWATRITAVGP